MIGLKTAFVAFLPLSLGLAGCVASIHDLYEQTKADALGDPGPVPDNWTPDASISLSWGMVEELMNSEISKKISKAERTGIGVALPLGAEVRLYPELEVAEATASSSRGCDTCISIGTTFSGQIRAAAFGYETRLPVDIGVETVLELSSTQEGDKMAVDARLHKVGVTLAQSLSLPHVQADLDNTVATWLRERLEQGFPTVRVAEFGADGVPIRALRIGSSAEAMQIGFLTKSPTPANVEAPVLSGADFAMAIEQTSILALARAAAFEEGPMDYDIVPEPTSIQIDGNAFTLGLRVWRLTGKGWWRDYNVRGTLSVEGNHMKVTPDQVDEVDKSPGAGLVDPLALLAGGLIIGAIEDAATIARPATLSQDMDGTAIHMSIQSVAGQFGVLQVRGMASMGTERRRKGRGGRK